LRLIELESESTLSDLGQALAGAAKDVPQAEAKFKQAEQNLAKATAEQARCQKLFGIYNSRIGLLWDKQRDAKLKAFDASVRELDGAAQACWKEYASVKQERERTISIFEYVSLYTMPEAEKNLLLASIFERERWCDYQEARVALQRLGLAIEMAKIADLDPGVRLAFSSETPEGVSEGSWSHGVMERVRTIRGRVLPELRVRLRDHDRTTAANRELATNLFN